MSARGRNPRSFGSKPGLIVHAVASTRTAPVLRCTLPLALHPVSRSASGSMARFGPVLTVPWPLPHPEPTAGLTVPPGLLAGGLLTGGVEAPPLPGVDGGSLPLPGVDGGPLPLPGFDGGPLPLPGFEGGPWPLPGVDGGPRPSGGSPPGGVDGGTLRIDDSA